MGFRADLPRFVRSLERGDLVDQPSPSSKDVVVVARDGRTRSRLALLAGQVDSQRDDEGGETSCPNSTGAGTREVVEGDLQPSHGGLPGPHLTLRREHALTALVAIGH